VTLVFSASIKISLITFECFIEQKELLIGNLQLVPESVENEDPVTITRLYQVFMYFSDCIAGSLINDDRASDLFHLRTMNSRTCSMIIRLPAWKPAAILLLTN